MYLNVNLASESIIIVYMLLIAERRGVPGSPGSLLVKFYKVSTGKTTKHLLGYLSNNFLFKAGDLEVDLKKGIVKIESASNEIAENITLAFCVSLLHVLCVPRPKGWTEGNQVMPTPRIRGTKLMTSVPSDNMTFVMAAGLWCSSPSNYYMRTYFRPYMLAMCGGGFIDYSHGWIDLPGDPDTGGDTGGDGCACGGGGGDGGGGDGGGGDGGGGGCGGCGG